MYKKLYLFIGLFILLVSLISCSKKESKSVDSNPQLFNAVGYSGTILSSPDGITWTYSTTYKISVTTGVKDDGAGNTLSSQYETGTGFTTVT